jgi:hypothetical protein
MTGLHPASALAPRPTLIVTGAALVTLLAHGLADGHPPSAPQTLTGALRGVRRR